MHSAREAKSAHTIIAILPIRSKLLEQPLSAAIVISSEEDRCYLATSNGCVTSDVSAAMIVFVDSQCCQTLDGSMVTGAIERKHASPLIVTRSSPRIFTSCTQLAIQFTDASSLRHRDGQRNL